MGAAETLDFDFIPTAAGTTGFDLAIGVVGSPVYGNILVSVTNAPPVSCDGDADGNGTVNFSDITSVLTNFGIICP